MSLPPRLAALLPLAGLALLALGLLFEAGGQPLTRFGPVLAALVAAVLIVRIVGRHRR